jgi:hypothetical protein
MADDDDQPETHAADGQQQQPMPAAFAGFAETAGPAAMLIDDADGGLEAPAENGGHRMPVDHDDDDAPETSADMQQAAIMSEPATPRRGWWNRFVRKSD